MSFKEVKIPLPWGFVAGKSWGDDKNKTVVALHGYQDNANSFDRLIQILPKCYHYLAVDLPGHGKSSKFITKGMPTIFDVVLTLKLILDYLKKDKYILMSHSFGAQISLFYTQMYPERVEKLISFDAAHFIPCDGYRFIPNLKNLFQKYTKLHDLKDETAPSYPVEVVVQKVQDSRIVPISTETAKLIIDRSLEPGENNLFRLTTAQQLKYLIRPPFSIDYMVEMILAHPIQCPHLLLMATGSSVYFEIIKPVVNALQKTNEYFETHVIEGTHDFHMEKAEEVANIVKTFLMKTPSIPSKL